MALKVPWELIHLLRRFTVSGMRHPRAWGRFTWIAGFVWVFVLSAAPVAALGSPATTAPVVGPERQARLVVKPGVVLGPPISRLLTGKFAEHLGSNIYNGMDAQVLRNPTFADFPFWDGSQTPDGLPHFLCDEAAIHEEIRKEAARLRFPEQVAARLVESRQDALAHWWVRVGPREAVRTSPDTGPHGGRAQRVEVSASGRGIGQWIYLPLHRVRRYAYQLIARSPDLTELTIALTAAGSGDPVARATVNGLSGAWASLKGTLQVPASAPSDALYQLTVTAPAAGQYVIDRVLLWPADQVGGADPDVVRLLREAHVPLLRWPGGNFASSYHWEDGVGPAEARPTRPNLAWGAVEPNLFGTDEYLRFCGEIGAEAIICVNAGSGTPQEAARWVEYCNSPPTSPMGGRRAANGHAAAYDVRRWEVGNELWGHWQVHWTSPRGYADRYRLFAAAMLKADPKITLYACGAPVLHGQEWNRTLIAEGGPLVRRITDHPLIGGTVPASTDPLDVYRNFMAVPDLLGNKWSELRDMMLKGGIAEPKLAITELQMFAHLGAESDGAARLTRQNLVTPATLAEAIYDTLVYHTALRLGPFVDLVTHSAVVNHGGGLRKEFERVYANPCYYAQSAFAAFQGATPVASALTGPTEHAAIVLPDLKGVVTNATFDVVSAIAARNGEGSLLVSIVHRGTGRPVRLRVDLEGFAAAPRAEVWSLSGEAPWAANSYEKPDAVKPVVDSVQVLNNNSLSVQLRPYTVMRIRIQSARQ